MGRFLRRKQTLGGGTAVTFDYTYSLEGRLTNVMKDGVTYEHYDYSAQNGNRSAAPPPFLSVTAPQVSYDAHDRLTTYGPYRYTYTNNGSLLTKTDTRTTPASVTTYAYDAQGNLLAVTPSSGPAISYIVDGQNRRIAKKVGASTVKQWIYRDSLKPVAELDGSGSLVSIFVYASNSNTPDLVVRNNATYRLLTDHVGSVLRAVNVADSSDVAFAAEYTAFGEQTVTTGNADFVPFGFAGGLSDAQTGLVRFGARDYDPSVGRWTSKDPILFDGGQANLYVYVNNDPVNLTDPEGRAVPPWVWTIPFWDGPEPGPADLAAAVLLVCIAAADILDAPISDAERCEQEWAAANRKCGGLIVDSSEEARRLRGGYSNVYDCAKGHVTKDCGGNLIDYGPKRRRRVFR